MAAEKKLKIDLTFKPEEFSEYNLKADSLKALKGCNPKPVKFKSDAAVDPDSMEEDEIKKSALEFMGGAIKLLDMHIKDPKRYTPQKAWDEFVKLVEKKTLKNWVKDLAKNAAGGSNPKAFKDGEKAMGDLAKAKPESIEKTRTDVLKVLEPLTKGTPDKKKIADANKELVKLKAAFEKEGKATQDAIEFLMDTAETYAKDRKADASLQKFGKDVETQGKKVYEPFLEAAEEFSDALDDAVEATEEEEMTAEMAQDLKKRFADLSSIKSLAAKAMQEGNKLQKQFKSVQDKFK
jgi:hypothetical protein